MGTRGTTPDRGRDQRLDAIAERMARFHRISWREALGRIAAPAVRVHRIRDLHTAMLREALGELDCDPRDE